MRLEDRILCLKEDIQHVKDGADFSRPIILSEAYPANPYIGEFSSVYRFIEVTDDLINKLEEIIEELEQ